MVVRGVSGLIMMGTWHVIMGLITAWQQGYEFTHIYVSYRTTCHIGLVWQDRIKYIEFFFKSYNPKRMNGSLWTVSIVGHILIPLCVSSVQFNVISKSFKILDSHCKTEIKH